MDINALLDVDLVAVESEDHLSVLLELTAPGRDSGAQRPPSTLQVVLDRSGSMSGERLDAAKDALESLIARLDPTDNFGLVTFDDEVAVPIPAGPLADKQAAREAIRSVWPGGMTNLSGGYLRGIQEARRVARDRGFTLLVLSDGHANVGVTDHAGLEQIASGAHHHGGTTSTIGIGLDYDEQLMAAIARGGAGNTHFAEQADEAGAALTTEVDDLLEQVIQAASLTIRPGSDATAIHLVNDLPATAVGGAVMVELGDFYAGEERRLMLAARRAGDERAGPDPDLRAGAPVRRRGDSHHRDRHRPGARQRRAGGPGRWPRAEPDGPERARLPDGPEGQARGHRGRERWRFRGGIPHLQRSGTQPRGLHTVRRSRDGGRAERGAEAPGRALTASGRGRGPDREAGSCRPAPQDAEEGSARSGGRRIGSDG